MTILLIPAEKVKLENQTENTKTIDPSPSAVKNESINEKPEKDAAKKTKKANKQIIDSKKNNEK